MFAGVRVSRVARADVREGEGGLVPDSFLPHLPPERGKAWRKAIKDWMGEPLEQLGPIWCPVAHMVAERPYGPGGLETKRGSKHFRPGAKLYVHCNVGYSGSGWQIEVVGHHRASHRHVTMIVSTSWLVDWRAELVYSPRVIVELWPMWDHTHESKARAEQWAQDANAASTPSESSPLEDSGS